MAQEIVGPWRIRAEWDDTISRSGPVRVVIEPDPDADPSELIGGISSTVLRRVRFDRPGPPRDSSQAERYLRNCARNREITPRYLARLAEVYAMLVEQDGHAAVSNVLAEIVDRAPSTVKAHIGEARRRGYLSPAIPHRPGGELTERGRSVLSV